jgi:hypothetical protein
MRRSFNTTGPCDPARHYMLPPVARLPDMAPFIDEQLYFVLHAPRQTGKTTAMRAFAEARARRPGLPRATGAAGRPVRCLPSGLGGGPHPCRWCC